MVSGAIDEGRESAFHLPYEGTGRLSVRAMNSNGECGRERAERRLYFCVTSASVNTGTRIKDKGQTKGPATAWKLCRCEQ